MKKILLLAIVSIFTLQIKIEAVTFYCTDSAARAIQNAPNHEREKVLIKKYWDSCSLFKDTDKGLLSKVDVDVKYFSDND